MWWTPARAVSTTISLLCASTAAETEAQGATAKAEAPAATFRTARRSRLESVEIVLCLFMVSAPYAVRKKGYTKLRCARKGAQLPNASKLVGRVSPAVHQRTLSGVKPVNRPPTWTLVLPQLTMLPRAMADP